MRSAGGKERTASDASGGPVGPSWSRLGADGSHEQSYRHRQPRSRRSRRGGARTCRAGAWHGEGPRPVRLRPRSTLHAMSWTCLAPGTSTMGAVEAGYRSMTATSGASTGRGASHVATSSKLPGGCSTPSPNCCNPRSWHRSGHARGRHHRADRPAPAAPRRRRARGGDAQPAHGGPARPRRASPAEAGWTQVEARGKHLLVTFANGLVVHVPPAHDGALPDRPGDATRERAGSTASGSTCAAPASAAQLDRRAGARAADAGAAGRSIRACAGSAATCSTTASTPRPPSGACAPATPPPRSAAPSSTSGGTGGHRERLALGGAARRRHPARPAAVADARRRHPDADRGHRRDADAGPGAHGRLRAHRAPLPALQHAGGRAASSATTGRRSYWCPACQH